MTCPICRRRQLVVIDIHVGREPVTLLTCSNCDQRWWQGIDGFLSLDSVLELAATNC